MIIIDLCELAAGADGLPTPQYAAYGATKAGIAHVMGSVAAECRENGIRVGVHTLSPGMVLTDLILDGATNQNKQVTVHSRNFFVVPMHSPACGYYYTVNKLLLACIQLMNEVIFPSSFLNKVFLLVICRNVLIYANCTSLFGLSLVMSSVTFRSESCRFNVTAA
jgi:NAD(P)-dependent dehydrogenase (short-subunit alcohol dehydrogenase family)